MGETVVVFDIGNVLLRWDARLLLGRLLGEGDVDAFLEEVDFAGWNLAQDAGRGWDEGVATLSAAFPHHGRTIADFHSRWHETLPGVVPGAPEILAALRAAGRPLYAITNYSTEKWAETLPRFPFLAESFRDVVVSGHERVTKPDPRIYRILIERNGLDPADCVFIDDSAANVAGAQAVGMDAIRFTDAGALAAELRARRLLD